MKRERVAKRVLEVMGWKFGSDIVFFKAFATKNSFKDFRYFIAAFFVIHAESFIDAVEEPEDEYDKDAQKKNFFPF